jgi:general secretion pathway protein G
MRQRLRSVRQNDSGFTLVELLVVVVILGVLSGIVVVSVQGMKHRAIAVACRSNQQNVEFAVMAYYARHGDYPATLAVLTAAPERFLLAAPTGVLLDSTTGTVTASPAC